MNVGHGSSMPYRKCENLDRENPARPKPAGLKGLFGSVRDTAGEVSEHIGHDATIFVVL